MSLPDRTLTSTYQTLRITYGLVPIVAGADKFLNLLTDWKQYINPAFERLMPFSPATFMMIVGVIEIVAGIVVLSRWTRLGGYIVSAWLACIALQLFGMGRFLDVGVRDLVMAVGAFSLARLAEVVHAGQATGSVEHPLRASRGAEPLLTPSPRT